MTRTIVLTLLFSVFAALPGAAKTAPQQGLPPENMVLIPAGDFWMGRTQTLWRDAIDAVPRSKMDDRPANLVYLDAFYMDRYEVTNEDYARFLEETGGEPPWHWHGGQVREGMERQAAFNVTWYEADAYCRWAGKRLPTEAEFEKASRGGLDRQPYTWGTGGGGRGGSPFEALGGNSAVEVGQYPPNGYGLYDMGGNVSEWTADWYGSHYYAFMPKENPKGPETGLYRSVRGSSWVGGGGARGSVFHRNFSPPDARIDSIGFRCAMSVAP